MDLHEELVDFEHDANRFDGTSQTLYTFRNGWKASVIRGPYTYGGAEGLFELGVLDPHGPLNYDPITPEDVRGYLTEDQVEELLNQLAALTPEELRDFQIDRKQKEVHNRLQTLSGTLKEITDIEQVLAELPPALRNAAEAIIRHFETVQEDTE
jgi:hypothetical protein